jgi:4-hydroxybenzoate polyprenyltransferase
MMPAAGGSGHVAWRGVLTAAARIRFRDVLVLQGPPLMGLALAWSSTLAGRLGTVLVFTVANVCLVAHVFTLNDWAGIAADQYDANKAARTFLTYGVSREEMGRLALGLGVLSVVLLGLLSWRSAVLGAAIVGLSVAYSHPRLGGKGAAGASSLLHLAGGVLHFLLGYGLTRSIDGRGLLLSFYFGLVFAAGHLSQEVRDHDGDRRAGLETAAVRLGPRRAFVVSFALFTIAVGLIVGLGLGRMAPPLLAGAAAAVYPVQALFFARALRDGLTFAAVDRYRARYRLLYALTGLALVLSLVPRV